MRQLKVLSWSCAIAAGLLATSAHAAMLTVVQGRVWLDTGLGFELASGGAALEAGDKLRLEPGAAAQVVFADGCVFPPADSVTWLVGEQSPCAIRASYPKPHFVGGAAQLYSHSITAPAKRPPVRKHARPGARKPLPFANAQLVRTAPVGPPNGLHVLKPVAVRPVMMPPQLRQPAPLHAPAQDEDEDRALAALPASPPPAPVFAAAAPSLSTGMIVAAGAAVAGTAVLVTTLSRSGESKKNRPASP